MSRDCKAALSTQQLFYISEQSDYQKSGNVTMTNYIDKVEVVREVNRQGLGYIG